MENTIKITLADIIENLRLSLKLPEIIEQIASQKIIEQTAKDIGIQIEQPELQTAADQIRLAHQLVSADDTWKWLDKHHLSIEDLEKVARSSAIAGKLSTHLFAEKVKPHFLENQIDYARAAIYEIVLDNEDIALELYFSIKEQEIEFYKAAQEYISDKALRRAGGYRGMVHRKELNPEVCAAVFAANPPELIKPFSSSEGIHLIYVEEIIQVDLDSKITIEILTKLFKDWIKQHLELIQIEAEYDVRIRS